MTGSVLDTVGLAEQAIKAHDAACLAHRRAIEYLVELQSERPKQKLEALCRVCEQQHPATTGKLFSVSQAEDVLQIDPQYAAYKVRVAQAEAAVKEAEDRKTSAFMVAQMRIAAFKAENNLL